MALALPCLLMRAGNTLCPQGQPSLCQGQMQVFQEMHIRIIGMAILVKYLTFEIKESQNSDLKR